MKRTQVFPLTCGLALAIAGIGNSAEPIEPLVRKTSSDLILESSTELLPEQRQAIAQNLGGDLKRITNSELRVHGRRIKVNVLTAVDESNAQAVHAGLLKVKPYPFCLRKGELVIEYVGQDIDAALALKASYELGVEQKPASIQYRVIAELATVDKADYMACNPLFNQFLSLQRGNNDDALQQINELSQRFRFGRTLVLRNPKLDGSAAHDFQPATMDSQETAATISYSFDQLPNRQGVPYATAMIDVTVDDTGFRQSSTTPLKQLIAATPYWPAEDPRIVALAQKITAGKTTNGAKAMAILESLAPGKNLKTSGPGGSRWGTLKVLEQKFGHCWDFSDCFVTLARAAGVPSRQVAGWLYGSDGHVWAEFYREGQGWQQVDPTGGGKLRCGIYHIPYFTTEDGEMPIVYVAMPKIEAMPIKDQ
jgi:Transglutaminase-like superfamily